MSALICAQKSKANSLAKGITLALSVEYGVYNENTAQLSPSLWTNFWPFPPVAEPWQP
jgi:hypothetical protein